MRRRKLVRRLQVDEVMSFMSLLGYDDSSYRSEAERLVDRLREIRRTAGRGQPTVHAVVDEVHRMTTESSVATTLLPRMPWQGER